MEEEIKSKMSSAVALMGLAFLLGTLAVGCEKGDAGAQGATGAQRTRSCNAAGCWEDFAVFDNHFEWRQSGWQYDQHWQDRDHWVQQLIALVWNRSRGAQSTALESLWR
jgi:hypothetical protein